MQLDFGSRARLEPATLWLTAKIVVSGINLLALNSSAFQIS
jgi:hypothetical protein